MTDYEDYKVELARWKQAVADDMTLLGFYTWLEHEAKALNEMTEIEMKNKEERHGR